jgi:UDP-glucose 4-epimerase
MRIGVTGGAGYIGSTLLKNLLDGGDGAVSIDDESIGEYTPVREYYLGERAEYVHGDIRDLGLLLQVFRDVDAIAHLAALPGLVRCREHPEEAVSVNIFGTHQVLEAARRLDIPRVVFCSSAAVYGEPEKLPVTEDHPLNPLNLYGVTKEAGEKLMNSYHHNHGLDTVNLRFGNIYGVGLYTRWDTVIPKFVQQALVGEPLTIYGEGDQSRDFVHCHDITQAIILSLKTPVSGETYNVGGETLTINRLAQLVKESVEEETGGTVEMTSAPPRVGETREFSYDLTKIKGELGFTNSWTVRSGVRQLIKYHQDMKE